jgi:hypothetical protein
MHLYSFAELQPGEANELQRKLTALNAIMDAEVSTVDDYVD